RTAGYSLDSLYCHSCWKLHCAALYLEEEIPYDLFCDTVSHHGKAGKNSQHGGMEPLFPLFSILTLIIFGKRQLSNAEVQCWAVWPDDSYWIPYMTVVAFLVYFIPLIII
ncbi:unnamed protein product, partial [Lepidochelys olivacea]